MVSQVIAARQLMKEGAEVAAGKNVKFLFISAENKHYERRVAAEELIEKGTNSDVKKYLLLYASAANMFSPFGYSTNRIYDEVRGAQQTRLVSARMRVPKLVCEVPYASGSAWFVRVDCGLSCE